MVAYSNQHGSGYCVLLLTATLAATGCSHDKPPATRILRSATLERNPNPTVSLAAIAHVLTNEPAKVTLDITGASIPTHVEFPELRTVHELPVLGLVPGKINSITITVETPGKVKETKTIPFVTERLPPEFPPLELTMTDTAAMEPGLTLFNVFQWESQVPGLVATRGWLIAVNSAGEVVWYQHPDSVPGDARQLPNGHILYEYDQTGFVEVDLLGNDVHRWHATGLGKPAPEGATLVDTHTMHHDIQELPNGHLLSLSTSMIPAPNYPTSERDPKAPPADTSVIVDKVNEFDRQGTIVREWFLDDMIDSYRIAYDSLTPFWDLVYHEQSNTTKDWSHANALVYSESDDAIIVSLRNQDALIKFRRETGSLVWILGTPANWKSPWKEYLLKAPADMPWFFHQHAPKVLSDGRILLFDNGNFRASPPDNKLPAKDNHSRVVEYRIDEAQGTVEQTWAYGGPETEIFYSPFLGDADALPKTGNVLITDGGRVTDDKGVASDEIFSGYKSARIFEVTREVKPRKVFEIQIKPATPVGSPGWSVYRAARIPGLYR